MVDFKIVSDSSSDVLSLEKVAFESAPLKIQTAEKEYVDDANLDVEQMASELLKYSGKSGSACPSVGDYIEAFKDAKHVFCVTITSGLSGSYNAAVIAKREYEEEYPGRKVFVIDSLSAGPELRLIIERLEELILKGLTFEEICEEIVEYQKHTGLAFILESLRNLANNGRVNKIVASAAGMLGIRVLGKASDQGDLEQLSKTRGMSKSIEKIVEIIRELGYNGGKIRIGHCANETAAKAIHDIVLSQFAKVDVCIYKLRGLCSFYAEKGGILIGFEK